MIKPPFANYHRATLERLVHEGFERIEARAAQLIDTPGAYSPPTPISHLEFQALVAADFYLRSTPSSAG